MVRGGGGGGGRGGRGRTIYIENGWMNNLRFYVLFNCISVMSGRWLSNNEIMKGCVQWNLVYDWKDSCPKQASNPGSLDQ